MKASVGENKGEMSTAEREGMGRREEKPQFPLVHLIRYGEEQPDKRGHSCREFESQRVPVSLGHCLVKDGEVHLVVI